MATLAQSLLGETNPFANWVTSNSNTLLGLGSGLLSGNLGNAPLYAMQGRQADTARSTEEERKRLEAQRLKNNADWLQRMGLSQVAELVNGGTEPGQALDMWRATQPGFGGDNLKNVGGHLYDAATGEWISPPATDNRQNVSLTPQWGQRVNPETGQPEWVMLQPSSTGDLVESRKPEGVDLVNPFDLNAQKAGGTAFGKQIGGAQFSLPQAELMAGQTLKAIADVKGNPQGLEEQFGNILGIPQQMTLAWPGTPKANFQAQVARLTNRAFLEARQLLRGGGQITDFESRKAESAITNIEDAMMRGDKQLFMTALNDFEQAVKDGLAKLQQQAGMMPGATPPMAQPGGGGYTVLGVE